MKILGGDFRSRDIIVPEGIRPVSLRVKKSCFDILRGEIEGKKVLDLFAGSGSLGIEAVSRGAERCVCVDYGKNCVAAIKKNFCSLDIKIQVRIYLKDVIAAIKYLFGHKEKFDIIFVDPPYYKGMLIKALQALEEYDILAFSGYIVAFCYVKDEFVKESSKFSLIMDRKYGQTQVLIYRKM